MKTTPWLKLVLQLEDIKGIEQAVQLLMQKLQNVITGVSHTHSAMLATYLARLCKLHGCAPTIGCHYSSMATNLCVGDAIAFMLQVERSTGLELSHEESPANAECRGEPLSSTCSADEASTYSTGVASVRTSQVHLSGSRQNFQHYQGLAEDVQELKEGMASITETMSKEEKGSMNKLEVCGRGLEGE
jgi:hypothetical protein